MLGFDPLAQLIKGQVVIVGNALADEETGFFIQQGLVAAGMRQCISRTGLALAAEEVFDRGETDLEKLGDFILRILTAFVRFDDSAA